MILDALASKHGISLGLGLVNFNDTHFRVVLNGSVIGQEGQANLIEATSAFPASVENKPAVGVHDFETDPEARQVSHTHTLSETIINILKERRFTDDYRTCSNGAILRIYSYSSRNPKNKWLLMDSKGTKYRASTEYVSRYFGY